MEYAILLSGLAEIKGPKHESRIVAMFDSIHASWFTNDETPWCAAFVGHCLERAGIQSTRSARARSYETWGNNLPGAVLVPGYTQRLPAIPYGSVVVLNSPGRGAGSGHVTFYYGPSGSGWAGYGGNQNDAVRVSPYEWDRIVAVRWPSGYALPSTPYRYPKIGPLVASTSDA